MKKCYVMTALFSGLFLFAGAQQRCGSFEAIKQQMEIDPVYANKVRQSERSFGNYQRRSGEQARPPRITIPVIVHVIYNSAEQNISDAQVQSQITVMNEDFSATNSDYNGYDAGYGNVKGDADISFCLVQIVRKATSKKSFPANDHMKFDKHGGSDAVNPMQALNIWVCNLGQNLLGYAYYPGAPLTVSGVVCHYRAFGRGASYNLFTNYDLGRTMTHEIGHSLGLAHMWGDSNCGSDFVDDTPLHNTANFGCPPEGHLSTCTGNPLEMFMNYMDYTDDRCMYFLTEGQVSRANFFLDTDPQLQSIINSDCAQSFSKPVTSSGITPFSTARIAQTGILVYPSVSSDQVNLRFNAGKTGVSELIVYNLNGIQVLRQSITVTKGTNNQTIQVGKLVNGVYLVRLQHGPEAMFTRLIVQH